MHCHQISDTLKPEENDNILNVFSEIDIVIVASDEQQRLFFISVGLLLAKIS